MTKEDIVNRVFERTELSKQRSRSVLEDLIDIMKDTLAEGEQVKISGFGRLYVVDRKARMGRNPETGAPAEIKAGRSIRFSPGKPLRNALNS